jgi:hypothetical protein
MTRGVRVLSNNAISLARPSVIYPCDTANLLFQNPPTGLVIFPANAFCSSGARSL